MLFFSQCCGYDLVNRYAGKLQPLATPHYGAEGCEGSKYANRCTMHTATVFDATRYRRLLNRTIVA